MSVKLIDNKAFYGYRVRRTVDEKLYQIYFSLKKNGKRMNPKQQANVMAEAEELDQELTDMQALARLPNEKNCFHKDGTIKGISFLNKKEKSGNATPIFQVGCMSLVEDRIICTSFSCNKHGHEKAWIMAARYFAEHKEINKRTNLYKKILGSMPGE